MKWILVYGVFVHWIPDDMGTYFSDMTLLTMAYDNLFSKDFIAILFICVSSSDTVCNLSAYCTRKQIFSKEQKVTKIHFFLPKNNNISFKHNRLNI